MDVLRAGPESDRRQGRRQPVLTELVGDVGGAFDLHSAHHVVGCPLYYQGEFSRALDHYEQAIGLYDFREHAPCAQTVGTGALPGTPG